MSQYLDDIMSAQAQRKVAGRGALTPQQVESAFQGDIAARYQAETASKQFGLQEKTEAAREAEFEKSLAFQQDVAGKQQAIGQLQTAVSGIGAVGQLALGYGVAKQAGLFGKSALPVYEGVEGAAGEGGLGEAAFTEGYAGAAGGVAPGTGAGYGIGAGETAGMGSTAYGGSAGAAEAGGTVSDVIGGSAAGGGEAAGAAGGAEAGGGACAGGEAAGAGAAAAKIATACTWEDSYEVLVFRQLRDRFMNEYHRRGYYIFSEWLVPYMRRWKWLKQFSKVMIVDTLVDCGQFMLGEKVTFPKLRSVVFGTLFMKFCSALGKTRKAFTRGNGEQV